MPTSPEQRRHSAGFAFLLWPSPALTIMIGGSLAASASRLSDLTSNRVRPDPGWGSPTLTANVLGESLIASTEPRGAEPPTVLQRNTDWKGRRLKTPRSVKGHAHRQTRHYRCAGFDLIAVIMWLCSDAKAKFLQQIKAKIMSDAIGNGTFYRSSDGGG